MNELLAIKSDFSRKDEWLSAFSKMDINVCFWDEIEEPADVDYALVWQPEANSLSQLTNLKVIFSVGAGLDHLTGADMLPPGIPVIRMVEDMLTAGMVEYVLYYTLHFHRFMPSYREQQQQRQWLPILQVPAHQRTVGILGFGVLGQACARAIQSLGFTVIGWSRSQKQLQGVTSYYGEDQLDAFLQRSTTLVCLLPLTDATAGLLNHENLSRLPAGANLINAGRGGHQIETDIIRLLDSGHLAAAALDVFESEPLPQKQPALATPKGFHHPPRGEHDRPGIQRQTRL